MAGTVRVTKAGNYIELGGASTQVTKAGFYVEITAAAVRVTQAGFYVEILENPSAVPATTVFVQCM